MQSDPLDELRRLFAAPIDRRRFLKRSAAGLVLLSAGSVLPTGCARYPRPGKALRFFNAKEYAVVNVSAERLLGVPGRVGSNDGQVDVATRLDPWLATWDLDAQQQLRVMLRIVEHGTSLFDLRRKRFTRLSPADQDRYLDGWMRSTMGARRLVFRALKAMAAAGFYADSGSWPTVGYDGPWLGRIEAATSIEPEATVPLVKIGAPS